MLACLVMPNARQVLFWKIGLSLLFVLPLLFLPLSYFPDIEIPEYDAVSLIFIRLLGGAYAALLLAELWGCLDATSLRGALVAAIAETALAALWLWHFVFYGYLSNWPLLGKIVVLAAATLSTAFAILLLATGSGALLSRRRDVVVADVPPVTPPSPGL
ncbi:MAG TPA: hypothetical protein VFD92_09570 [Candidatus Binatia bacterium]|nr:hypothetical protein [Candidatus Binatia bacterium]